MDRDGVVRGRRRRSRRRSQQAGRGRVRAVCSGADMGEWRRARWHITEAIAGDGTFLDAGCVNGLLMESVAAWCAERGLAVEPYGVDISPALADLARQRLPQWAGRIWAGTTWRTPSARCPADP